MIVDITHTHTHAAPGRRELVPASGGRLGLTPHGDVAVGKGLDVTALLPLNGGKEGTVTSFERKGVASVPASRPLGDADLLGSRTEREL